MVPYPPHAKDLEKGTALLQALQQSRESEKSWEVKAETTGIPDGLGGLFDRKEDSFLLKSNKKWDLFSLLWFQSNVQGI